MRNALVKLLGHTATLIHGDTMVLDRWLWLKSRIYRTKNNESLLDVGCGSGAFTIGAALRGYRSVGLSWDEKTQALATERASLLHADAARFELCDVRLLDQRRDFVEAFDVALCCENIEHIIDDKKLMVDIARCLKPGGYLFLTTPYLRHKELDDYDMGPWVPVEDGAHVRRGYSRAMLNELCNQAGLIVEQQSFCSGYISQKICRWQRVLSRRIGSLAAWAAILPLRFLPPLFDSIVTRLRGYSYYSICIEAYKPRI